MSPRLRPLLPALVCLITACGIDQTFTGPASDVQGEIIFPPQTGQAVFYADTGSSTPQAVVSFTVKQDGQYAITLPAPTQLSAAGHSAVLPTLPDVWLLGFAHSSCQSSTGTIKMSDPAARLAVINSGQFVLNGKTVAQLLPSTQAVGGLAAQELISSKRLYAYADRAVHISGDLDCVLTRSDGSTLAGKVSVDYNLSSGWNVLTLQTSQQTRGTPLQMTATAEAPSTSVQWRYVPVN